MRHEEIKIRQSSIEIWKDIQGYEGLYQVSNIGRVRSFVIRGHGGVTERCRTLCQGKTRFGYLFVNLSKNRKHQTYRVHRLVAIAFLDNPERKRDVNHINGKKRDNRLENLEWATRSENELHAYRIGLKKTPQSAREIAKIVDGKIVRTYSSILAASKQEHVSRGNLQGVLSGKRKTVSKMKFIYVT